MVEVDKDGRYHHPQHGNYPESRDERSEDEACCSMALRFHEWGYVNYTNMVFINEWLPNPTGNDAKGEFVELFNSASAPAILNGWVLKTSGKKTASLGGYSIAAHGYLLLDKTETKLSLKNTDEQIFLYDASGRLADHSSFAGAALSGKSLSRVNYTTDPADHFAWSYPTPGAVNDITLNTFISAHSYSLNVPLNHGATLGIGEIFVMALGLGVILAALVIYCVKRHEEIASLIFDGGNTAVR